MLEKVAVQTQSKVILADNKTNSYHLQCHYCPTEREGEGGGGGEAGKGGTTVITKHLRNL